MSDSIFEFVWFRNHPFIDMLDLFTLTATIRSGTAVIDMYMSAHGRANKITHHRRSLVIGQRLSTPQLESCPVWPINCPTGLCHGSMASLVFLLRVTLED
jgi:hypothetical protein